VLQFIAALTFIWVDVSFRAGLFLRSSFGINPPSPFAFPLVTICIARVAANSVSRMTIDLDLVFLGCCECCNNEGAFTMGGVSSEVERVLLSERTKTVDASPLRLA
jgi:hypothetical protein